MVRMSRGVPLFVCPTVVCLCGAAVVPARAQTAAGEITGLVQDQAGAAVPGATVTVSETRTNLRRVVVSTGDGVYAVASLAPGEYRLDVQLSGFKPLRREGIRLATGEKVRIDLDLTVGDLREQVTVVADAPIVRAETASLGTVVENEQVMQLPLNGRLFIMLAAIAPGVALPPNSVLPRINGGRPRTNGYLFDGISVLQPEPGQVAYYPIIDAIQEFKIESNGPPAEFGRFNGGVVNLTTKSGTNAFRGTLFEFFRSEHLNAGNYFQQGNPVKPDYRRNQYGGMFGGPLAKDRAFFFVDYQGQRQTIGRHGDLERADARRTLRCLPPEYLRSGDDGGKSASAVSEQHDSERRHGSGRAVASRALPASDKHRHRAYPDYTAVSFYRNNVGTTNYQGLAFSIRQRMSSGLTYSAAYTRSKLTDIASSVFDASILTGPLTNAAVADSHNLERDRDYSTGDIPHYFAASVVWDLPAGEGRARQPTGVVGALVNDWSVATFMTMQSGVPVAVTQANSLGYAGFTTQRPNLVGDPALPADERTPARWFKHCRVRDSQSVHHRIRLAQSRAGAVVPQCRSRGDASRAARRCARDRASVGGVQPAEHGQLRRTGGAARTGQLRNDHDGARSPGCAARGEVLVLRRTPPSGRPEALRHCGRAPRSRGAGA